MPGYLSGAQYRTVFLHALHGMSDSDMSSSAFKSGSVAKPRHEVWQVFERVMKKTQIGSKLLRAAARKFIEIAIIKKEIETEIMVDAMQQGT